MRSLFPFLLLATYPLPAQEIKKSLEKLEALESRLLQTITRLENELKTIGELKKEIVSVAPFTEVQEIKSRQFRLIQLKAGNNNIKGEVIAIFKNGLLEPSLKSDKIPVDPDPTNIYTALVWE